MNSSIFWDAFCIAGMTTCGLVMASVYVFPSLLESSEDNEVPTPTYTKEEQERIDLAEACAPWAGTQELPLRQVCQLWVTKSEGKVKITRPTFTNAYINDFYTEIVEKQKSINGPRKNIINKLLVLLDNEGHCPSVVRNAARSEEDNKRDEVQFDLLAQITLGEHAINVARALAKATKEALVADAVIVALAHDLGKIPKWHSASYTTGDHPKISTMVIESTAPEFKTLTNFNGLRNTILEHHLLLTKNGMTTALKECDGVVRNSELARMIGQKVEAAELSSGLLAFTGETPEEKISVARGPSSSSPVSLQQPVAKVPSLSIQTVKAKESSKAERPAAAFAPTELLGNEQYPQYPKEAEPEPPPQPVYKPKRIYLPWFDIDVFLNELKAEINVVNGKSWGAVSMVDGLVYVQPHCTWAILQRIAPDSERATMMLASANEADKRNIMFSAIWDLGEKRQAVQLSYLNPLSYVIPVEWVDGNGEKMRSATGKAFPMIPFKAEAFGALASDLETLKSMALRRIVKSITPLIPSDKKRYP